jgi:O-acetyl-ADP-ribose deacetylase (regulator of RNase III)
MMIGGISGRMFYYGGPDLVNECAQAEGCPTGDAMITKAYGLPAK